MTTLSKDKCSGAMLAAAIGDALGWPFESRSGNRNKQLAANGQFQTWVRQNGGRFWPHYETIERGEYSDDTQLLLAVARSLQYGEKWNNYFVRQELPFWLKYERGGGKAMKSAARIWEKRGCPWSEKNDFKDVTAYFNAGANGVAMRILPHVICCLDSDDVDSLMSIVIRNGMYTHGHPRALLGATCYAYALYIAGRKTDSLDYGELVDSILQGQEHWGKFHDILPEWKEIGSRALHCDYETLWENTANYICQNLQRMKSILKSGLLVDTDGFLNSIGCFSPATNGAGDVSALTAIYFASKYAANPKQGIMAAAYLKNTDSDTNASMTGALLGMIQGIEWIPYEWRTVQDYEYITKLSSELLRYGGNAVSTDIAQNDMKLTTDMLAPIDQPEVYNGSHITVTIQKYKAKWGQTLYIKSFEREKTEQPALKDTVTQTARLQSENQKITYEVLNLLIELSDVDKKLSLSKLTKIVSLVLSTNLSDEEIARRTKSQETIVKNIRDKCEK